MRLAWVLGAGGMLGTALRRTLVRRGAGVYLPAWRFAWSDEARVRSQFEAASEAFAARLSPGKAWEIYWAAGVGTLGAGAAEAARETRLLEHLLGCASRLPAPGTLVLASSAGAIYAGSADEFVTESSQVAPTTDYAREKLEQERRVADFVAANPGMCGLIGRISTLYGLQPHPDKPQGLIAAMARSMVLRHPIRVYVPLDTIRDYLAVDDAAEALVGLADSLCGPALLTRIIASEQATTISEVVAIFKRLSHRAPRLYTSSSPLASVYRRRIQFRSKHAALAEVWPQTSLVVGISRLLAAERLAFATRTRA